MMCDDCGVRPASIHLTTIAGGEKQEKNLCPVCMAKIQKTMPNIDFSGLAGLLSGFLAAAKNSEAEDDQPDIKCERCGMTYQTFKKTGMLGCADCYKAFQDPLKALLTRVHGHTQHVGRVPGGEGSNISVRLNIEKLKQELVRAIAAEEYEQAAALRDRIRALNASLTADEAKGGEDHG